MEQAVEGRQWTAEKGRGWSEERESRSELREAGPVAASGGVVTCPCCLLTVFAVVAVEVGGEVEGYEADSGASVAGLYSYDVLVEVGAGAEFEVVVRGVDVDLAMASLVVAGEALRGVRGRADGVIVAALDDVAVAGGEVFAVEGEDLVLRVGGLEAGGLDAEVEAAEAHVDIGGA